MLADKKAHSMLVVTSDHVEIWVQSVVGYVTDCEHDQ